MWHRRLIAIAAIVVAGNVAGAGEAPGSLMVFPMYNNHDGFVTLLTVTNTSRTTDVNVRFNYYDGFNCERFDRTDHLTPLDTFSCTARAHNPNIQVKGYVTAHARSSLTDEPIAFNHLVATSLIIDGFNGSSYALNPFMFEGIGDGDINGNDKRDLDGVEYSTAPASIIIPRFLGQKAGVSTSRLILIDAAGGWHWTCYVDFIIFNDNEEVFSAQHSFQCWDEVELLDVSQLFSNDFLKNFTNHNPYEIRGFPEAEAGWFFMNGERCTGVFGLIPRPAILAVLIEPTIGLEAAAAPFETGERLNGKFY